MQRKNYLANLEQKISLRKECDSFLKMSNLELTDNYSPFHKWIDIQRQTVNTQKTKWITATLKVNL